MQRSTELLSDENSLPAEELLAIENWLHITNFLPLKDSTSLSAVSKSLGELKNTAIINFILNELSQLSLVEAKEFLEKFWQSSFYKILKEKCNTQPWSLTASELFCFMLTREGNQHQLYRDLLGRFCVLLEKKGADLNVVTQHHLELIKQALVLSYQTANESAALSVFTILLKNRHNENFLNLAGINFSMRKFISLRLENVFLNHAKFNSSSLNSSYFNDSSLCFVDFSGATIISCSFNFCHLYKTKFPRYRANTSSHEHANFFSHELSSLVELKTEFSQLKPLLDRFATPIAYNLVQQLKQMTTVDNNEKIEFLREIKITFSNSAFQPTFFAFDQSNSSVDVLEAAEEELMSELKNTSSAKKSLL